VKPIACPAVVRPRCHPAGGRRGTQSRAELIEILKTEGEWCRREVAQEIAGF
jgi:hypothetical protein